MISLIQEADYTNDTWLLTLMFVRIASCNIWRHLITFS
jgi:hypothetical protein